jgi:hypothetical protein
VEGRRADARFDGHPRDPEDRHRGLTSDEINDLADALEDGLVPQVAALGFKLSVKRHTQELYWTPAGSFSTLESHVEGEGANAVDVNTETVVQLESFNLRDVTETWDINVPSTSGTPEMSGFDKSTPIINAGTVIPFPGNPNPVRPGIGPRPVAPFQRPWTPARVDYWGTVATLALANIYVWPAVVGEVYCAFQDNQSYNGCMADYDRDGAWPWARQHE